MLCSDALIDVQLMLVVMMLICCIKYAMQLLGPPVWYSPCGGLMGLVHQELAWLVVQQAESTVLSNGAPACFTWPALAVHLHVVP